MNERRSEAQTRLEQASTKGDLDGINDALEDGADASEGSSLSLCRAVVHGHKECFRRLLPLSSVSDAKALLTESLFGFAVPKLDAMLEETRLRDMYAAWGIQDRKSV